MKYSQPARAASSKRDFSLSGATIKPFRFIRPKIRHSLKYAVGPRIAQQSSAIAGLIMAAPNKAPHHHAGRLAGLHTAHAVLNHEGATRIRPHGGGCVQEEIGRGLAAFHHLRGIKPSVKMRRETCEGKGEGHPIEIAGRGDARWDLQALEHGAHSFDWPKRGEKRCTNPCPQFGRELLRNQTPQRFVVLADRGHASSKE